MSTTTVEHAEAVNAHIEKHLLPPNPALTHAYENSTAHNIPIIAVSPSQGKFLSLLTTLSSSRNILELGTLGGYSSIWFASAIKGAHNSSGSSGVGGSGGAASGGKVTSIEIDPMRREVAIANLEHAGVKVPEEAEVILGAGLDVLPQLGEEIAAGRREAFDFVFVDADWENQRKYFDWGVKLCKGKGSVIYVDNVVRQLLESGIVGRRRGKKRRMIWWSGWVRMGE
ncbi:hypothetical protein MMC14_009390 [Varicellaria rhodocarpa]|nr:hypothetical protein [Varicellaria rhodocarpa]